MIIVRQIFRGAGLLFTILPPVLAWQGMISSSATHHLMIAGAVAWFGASLVLPARPQAKG
jgi:hypothetical protein